MDFEKVDLREQVKGLEGKWYWEDYKSRTQVEKDTVIFDKDFKFELEYSPIDICQETKDIVLEKDIIIDGVKEFSKGEIIHYEKGEVIGEDYIVAKLDGRTIGYYNDDKYSAHPNEILENIMVYIANRI